VRLKDALKHCTKYSWTNSAPVEIRALEKRFSHIAVKGRDAGTLGEQVAIDVSETAQRFVQIRLAFIIWRV